MDSLFFIDFNSTYLKYNNIISFFFINNDLLFNFILIILIIYPLIVKYNLIFSLKESIDNLIRFIKDSEKDYYFIEDHFFYSIFYFKEKPNFIRLTFRLFEVKKEVKEKYKDRKVYISWQYLDFYFIEIILDLFYSLILRLVYFYFLFILKIFIYIFNSIFYKFFFNTYLFNIFYYLYIHIFVYIIYLGKFFYFKIYSFLNYIKLESFIYVINDNNFYGGLFLYIYNSLYYKIPIFNNIKNHNKHKLPHHRWVEYLFSYWKKSVTYIYLLNYKKKYNRYNISNFLYVLLRYIFYNLNYIVKFINYIRIYFIWIFINLFKFLFKLNLNYIYMSIGFIFFFFYDLLINLIISIIIFFYKFLLKFKYILIIYLFYKFGLIYLFYVSSVFFLADTIPGYLDIVFYEGLSMIYYINDIILGKNLELNEGIFSVWVYDYNDLLIKRENYKHNTVLGKLSLFSLRNIDVSNFNLSSIYDLTEIYESSPLRYTWRKYFYNIFNVIYMEIRDYLILKFYFFLYNNIKIYNLFLLFTSDENLLLYTLKKLYLTLYLLMIYLLMYLKYLYFYIVPYYFLSSILLNWFIVYNKIWYWLSLFYFILWFIYSMSICISYYIYTNVYIYISICISLSKEIMFYCFFSIFISYNIIEKIIYYFISYLGLSINISINMFINFYESYIYIYIYINLIVSKIKDILINYLRLPINNFIDFKYNDDVIVGNKVLAHTQYNLDQLDLDKIKKNGGLEKTQMDESLIRDILSRKFEDYFSYINRLYIYNNLYFLRDIFYSNVYHWNILFFEDLWIINYYIRNIIFYSFLDIYILFYLIFFFIFKKIFNLNIYRHYNYNVDYLWYKFRKNFTYKELNNNNYYLKCIYYYQKMHRKKKLSVNLFNYINTQWSKINKIKKYKSREILNNTNLGLKNTYFTLNNKLKYFLIEKNMYFNNKKFFYWKNLVLFDEKYNSDGNFISRYEDGKSYNLLNFLLSLTFKKNIYCMPIFFYFDSSNKYFYWNNNYNSFFYNTSYIMNNYFNSISSWLKLSNNDNLLHKDSSLVFFKDEDDNISDMYSMNFNTLIPKFWYDFFWLAFILYILVIRLKCRSIWFYDLESMYLRITYIKMILINNNFMYFYDIAIYWFNYVFMFDMKISGYEQHDFRHSLSKTKRYYKLIRPSSLFLLNNDPLYLLKKNYSYHLILDCNIKYNLIYSTSYLLYWTYIKYWLNLIIFMWCYKNLLSYNNDNIINLNNFININYIYKKNIITYLNYLIKKFSFK